MEKFKKLIIYGKGVTADLAYYYFQKYTEYEVIAFCTENQYLDVSTKNDLPLVDFYDIEKTYPIDEYHMFIALGFGNVNQERRKIYFEAKKLGYPITSFIHPTVANEAVRVGENCFIYENVVLQPYSVVEDNAVIAPLSLVGHHSTIKHSAFISSSVTIQGSVKIGENTFIGPNTNILPRLNIGDNNIVLFNTIIRADTTSGKIYYTQHGNIVSRDIKYAKLFKEF